MPRSDPSVLNQFCDLLTIPATDQELLQRFVVSGDETAFQDLLERYGPMVMRVCRHRLADVHAAEDAFQATFLVLARKAGCVRPDALGCWLHSVACRSTNRLRGPAVMPVSDSGIAPVDPLAEITLREARAVLDEELERLPEKYRYPLILCYLEEKTRDEAVRQLGWPEGTFKRRLERGRELLRQRLARRGLTLSAGLLVTLLSGGAVPAALNQMVLQHALLAGKGRMTNGLATLLGEGVLGTMATSKLKLAGYFSLVLVLGALGIRTIYLHALVQPLGMENPPAAEQKAAAPESIAEVKAPRVDRYGDVLPEGAIARLGTVRFRPGKQVSNLALSPDGRLVATTCENGLHLWDLATGKEVRQLTSEHIHAAFFSPNGATLYADNWKTITAWDVATGKALHQYEPQEKGSGIQAFVLSSDGNKLAFAGPDDTIRLLDAVTGKEVRTLHCGRQQTKLALSPDGKTVVSVGLKEGFGLCVWDATSGKEVRQIPTDRHATWAIAFSPDGRTVASAGTLFGDNNQNKAIVLVFDVASGKELHRMELQSNRYAYAVAFSPDGKTLASGSDDDILLWETATGKQCGRLAERSVHCLAFTKAGDRLISGSNNSTVRLWDLAAMKECTPIEGGSSWIADAVWLPDHKTVATRSMEGLIQVWDMASTKELRRFGPVQGSSAFSPDRSQLVVHGGKNIQIWDMANGREVLRFPVTWDSGSIGNFSRDGKRLAVEGDGLVIVCEVGTGKILREFRMQETQVGQTAFSPDGKCLAIGDSRSTVRLWDLESGKELRKLSVSADERPANPNVVIVNGNDYVDSLVFSPDGKILAAGGTGPLIHVWEVATGREIRRLKVRTEDYQDKLRVLHLAFSPDGKMLAGSGFGRSVRLWELVSGQEIGRLEGHRGAVRSLAFSSDGRTLLSGSQDTTALLWDIAGLGFIHNDEGSQPGALDLESLWKELGHPETAPAFRALKALRADALHSLPFLAKQLKPAAAPDSRQITQWVINLESKEFEVRKAAEEELSQLGEFAEAALENALAQEPSLEMAQRGDRLLNQLKQSIPVPETLRALRLVTILESLGTPEARRILQSLAAGAPGHRITEDAKAALLRR